MAVNLMQKGRKIYSVPKTAAGLDRSVVQVNIGAAARKIEMIIRNLDTVNTMVIKPQESADNITYADLPASCVGAMGDLTATATDTLTIRPGGRGHLHFAVRKDFWRLNGSGGPGLIEVHFQGQNFSPVEGQG